MRKPPSVLKLKAPAKINLSLKVTGRRSDGYHNIESLFQPLDLSDELELVPTAEPEIALNCPGGGLPQGRDNLAWRAAELFFAETGQAFGLRINLTKVIPVAAGLGGGSSDAAAVLKGVNKLAGSPFGPAELEEMGSRLGADVPFFIRCRPAWAFGTGGMLRPVKLPEFDYVLVNPGFEVSTAWAYQALIKTLTAGDPVATIDPHKVEKYQDLLDLTNDLEPVVEEAWPEILELKARLLEAGAGLARMTGSGPTVFGLFAAPSEAAEAVRRLERQKDELGRPWRVILAKGLS